MGFHSDIPLVVVTIVLAWATYRLAQHTKALSDFTKQLVTIEETRDHLQRQEKRRTEIACCLKLAEKLRKIDPEDFVTQLNQPGKIPEPTSSYIRELALRTEYIADPDTVRYLRELRQTLNSVEQGSSIGANGPEIAKKLKRVQERLGWSITQWQGELQMSEVA
jgi:hypothetical protein